MRGKIETIRKAAEALLADKVDDHVMGIAGTGTLGPDGQGDVVMMDA
jgi:hypothetical protein